MNRKELIKEFDKKLQALRSEFINHLNAKGEFEIEYPKDGDRVYFISNADSSVQTTPFNYEHDHLMFERGLYFKTDLEAEQCIKERTLLVKLRQWAKMKNGDWKPDWSDYNVDKFVILHDGEDDVFQVNNWTLSNHISILPVFKSREIAQECIDLFGDEIIEVFINSNLEENDDE